MNDVLAEFSPEEQAALSNVQANGGNLQTILTKVVAKVRSQIKAGGNQLDQTGASIPDSLVEEVISITRWRWLLSFPGVEGLQTKERKAAYDEAVETLKEISSNKPDRPRVELPAVPDSTPAPVSSVAVARTGRCVRPRGFDKIGST